MIREEAINILRGMRADNFNFDDTYTKNKYNALDMAIKALQLITDIETVLHNSSYVTNDEYEDEVIEVELIQRILNKVKEEEWYGRYKVSN